MSKHIEKEIKEFLKKQTNYYSTTYMPRQVNLDQQNIIRERKFSSM